jgi:hypothetical protein
LIKREENLPAIPVAHSLLTQTDSKPAQEVTPLPVVSQSEAASEVSYPVTPKPSEPVVEINPQHNSSYTPNNHQAFVPQTPVNPVAPVAAPQQSWATPQPQVPTPPVTPVPPPAPKDDDDSGLYSMRNFSV